MAEKKPIVCKCGKLIRYTTNSSGGGTTICPACKKRIRWDATPNKVYVAYQN